MPSTARFRGPIRRRSSPLAAKKRRKGRGEKGKRRRSRPAEIVSFEGTWNVLGTATRAFFQKEKKGKRGKGGKGTAPSRIATGRDSVRFRQPPPRREPPGKKRRGGRNRDVSCCPASFGLCLPAGRKGKGLSEFGKFVAPISLTAHISIKGRGGGRARSIVLFLRDEQVKEGRGERIGRPPIT